MEATILLPESAKQMKMEKRGNSMRREDGASDGHQQAEEDNVGRIESFRLEEAFLAACKDGNLPVVRFCLENRVNVNCNHGWALRRAIRHRHAEVWEAIVASHGVALSSANTHGLTALHTAARFGVAEAITLLLRQPGILVNSRTIQGSSPLLVGAKYGNVEAVKLLLKDERGDVGLVDNQGRSVQGVVGVADFNCTNETKLEILELVKKETERRSAQKSALKKKSTMRQDMDPSQFIVQQAREKVKKLMEALEDTQRIKMLRFQEYMETNRKEFAEKQKLDLENFMESVEEAWHNFLEQQENHKNSFRSQLELQKSVFLAMQKETQDEFLSNEELSLSKFQEKQVEERAMLQTKGEDLEAVSSSNLPPTQYTYYDHLTSSYPQTEAKREMCPSPRRHSESSNTRTTLRSNDLTEEGRRVSCPVPSSPPVFREARRHSAQAMLQSRETSAQPRVLSSSHQNIEGGTHQNGDFCCPGILSHPQTSHQSRELSLQPHNNGMKRGSSQQSREATHPSREYSREPSSTKTSLERGSRSREIVNQFLPAKNFTEEPRGASCSKSRASSRQGDISHLASPQLLSHPPPLSLGVPAKYPSLFQPHPHSATGQLAPTTPSVTPPSPSSALPPARNPLLRQKTLPSPSSMSSMSATRPTSSSSLSPSPVPSLEWVSQGEPILTIPDTCPAIRALLTYTPDLDLSSHLHS